MMELLAMLVRGISTLSKNEASPMSKKEAYEDQLKNKTSCDTFIKQQKRKDSSPNKIKSYFFLKE